MLNLLRFLCVPFCALEGACAFCIIVFCTCRQKYFGTRTEHEALLAAAQQCIRGKSLSEPHSPFYLHFNKILEATAARLFERLQLV